MPIINMGVSREEKCLLNIVSQKQISYDFCTSFALHKMKKTFGGSKWKLVKLTRVSRYLAYVTRPHDKRIRVCCEQLKNLMEVKKQTAAAYKKTCFAGKNGCCCATYVMVCARKKRKLSMERET
jgi:hypothetical protein